MANIEPMFCFLTAHPHFPELKVKPTTGLYLGNTCIVFPQVNRHLAQCVNIFGHARRCLQIPFPKLADNVDH